MGGETTKCGTTELADECFDGLATGDVLLYRGNGLGAACTSNLLRSKWTHAGIVVRLPRDCVLKFYSADYTSVAASSAARESLHVLEAVPRRGVSLFPLEARLARTVAANRRVAVRQLRVAGTEESPQLGAAELAKLEDFIGTVLGRQLETALNSCAPICSALRQLLCARHAGGGGTEDWEQFFCTELVAEALQQLGVLREDGVNSNEFLPNAFASEAVSPSGRPLALTLDSACADGFGFGGEVLLQYPGSPFAAFLRERKKALKAALRRRNVSMLPTAAVTKLRTSSRQSGV